MASKTDGKKSVLADPRLEQLLGIFDYQTVEELKSNLSQNKLAEKVVVLTSKKKGQTVKAGTFKSWTSTFETLIELLNMPDRVDQVDEVHGEGTSVHIDGVEGVCRQSRVRVRVAHHLRALGGFREGSTPNPRAAAESAVWPPVAQNVNAGNAVEEVDSDALTGKARAIVLALLSGEELDAGDLEMSDSHLAVLEAQLEEQTLNLEAAVKEKFEELARDTELDNTVARVLDNAQVRVLINTLSDPHVCAERIHLRFVSHRNWVSIGHPTSSSLSSHSHVRTAFRKLRF